ncbi:MAG TPA: exo-alpha-sialidase [Cyclobacteriaceae bacterium]|nr:exo-alpha-sialidase [Cyclobacteriaceae bacterium]HRJ80925.1 exo-alpha-sialidase [Cyclobacteriaceae bacterium]
MNRLLIPLLALLLVAGCQPTKKNSEPVVKYLDSPARASSGEPYLFTAANGSVYLSWIEKKESQSEFKFSELTGDRWTEPISISSGNDWFVNWADYPMLVTNGQEFIAHHLAKSGESPYAYDIKLTTSKDGGKTWIEAGVLHDDGKQAEHGFVTLLPYNENFFVVWLDGRNTVMEGMENMAGHHGSHHGAMSLRAAILDSQGKKINEWELDNKTCDCCQTSAAITDNGPVVVYRDRSDEEIRDISILRLIDGKWTSPKAINDDNWKIAGCPVNGPRVEADGNVLVIAWYSVPEGNAQVNVIFSTDGGKTFGKPIRVDESDAIGRVDIVMLDKENVMVSWMEGAVIKAAKISQNGTKGTPVVIASSSKSRSSGFPQMTKSGDQIIFAWTDDESKLVKTAFLTL